MISIIRINRNIVECKVDSLNLFITAEAVLIETLWNVKFRFCVIQSRFICVLIETLWNVKGVMNLAAASGEDRINRNIVECKVSYTAAAIQALLVLIETLWNVKVLRRLPESETSPVLIETLWNVKQMSESKTKETASRINRNIVECKVQITGRVVSALPLY